jgi:hypothetical protein
MRAADSFTSLVGSGDLYELYVYTGSDQYIRCGQCFDLFESVCK